MENIELSECTYEHIKDTFYYGLFGDVKLVIDKATGCFNATKLCIDGGKEYKKWSRLEKSKNMVSFVGSQKEYWVVKLLKILVYSSVWLVSKNAGCK